jgi:hypothetical protein
VTTKPKSQRHWLSFSASERDQLNLEWWESLGARERQEITMALLAKARQESGWRPQSQDNGLDDDMMSL